MSAIPATTLPLQTHLGSGTSHLPEQRLPALTAATPQQLQTTAQKPAMVVQNSQIIKEFFNEIKKGNLQNILHKMEENCLDITKLVDDNFRHTSLFYAAVIPNPEESLQVIKYFVEHGVPATYTDILNQTVIYYSSREGKIDCSKYLMEKGCSINHKDNYGQTPLFYACREGHAELVKQMISWGVEVNSEDNLGQTALFYAAREGKTEICKLLIASKASVNKQDKKKQSPLYWAKKHQRQDVVELLINHGAIYPKEQTAQSKESKKEKVKNTKKKIPEKPVAKKYVLSKWTNNTWIPLSFDEVKDFGDKYPDIGKYINDPSQVDKIKLPDIPSSVTLYESWDKAAKRILNHLWKQNGAIIFHEPVDPIVFNIPDYPDVIKNPMDFGTVKSKLTKNAYRSPKDFITDVELVFSNCIIYNGDNTDYGVIAKTVRDEFRKQCEQIKFDYYYS